MMDRLHITSLRPGADGLNAQAPNARNTDEVKATRYTNLPDPLVLKNGGKVTTAKTWWTQRRPEIVEDFDRAVYGRVPKVTPPKSRPQSHAPKVTPRVTWEMVKTTPETNGDVPFITKQLVEHMDNAADPAIPVSIQLTLTTPANARGPVPVMMEFGFPPFPGGRRGGFPSPPGPTWQQQVLAKGWGYAVLVPASFAVDAMQVGMEGLSRYGKAVLVAMACEPRFAIVFVGSSGEGGAKLWRRNYGETEGNIASSGEYHWMAGNFLKYDGPLTLGDLPVDSHELIALCAPSSSATARRRWKGPGWMTGAR